jgi:hypothetical protein
MTLTSPMNSARGAAPPAPDSTSRKTIPFDYAFRFTLEGEPGKTHIQSLSISVEASFTAVSIGYGVIPNTPTLNFGLTPASIAEGAVGNAQQPVTDLVNALAPSFNAILPPPPPAGGPILLLAAGPAPVRTRRAALREFAQRTFLHLTVSALAESVGEPLNPASPNPVIGPQTAAALRNGIKFNPEFIERLLLSLNGGELDDGTFLEAFQGVAAPLDRIQFLYALSDAGSGREYQSEPILSTSGLGAPDGGRPFRYFARPIDFAARTAIRMQITEVSDFAGELHISLQGYKTLGGAGSPTAINGARRGGRRRRR